MAQIKITALTEGSPQGTDEIPGVDITDTTQSSSGTTKKYIRSDVLNYYLTAQGLTTYTAAIAATTAALTVVYDNGTLGVGATLTNAGAQTALEIDGVTLAASDRVLVKNQASSFQNGIYTVTDIGSDASNWVMTRATDYDEASEIVQYGVLVSDQGTTNAGLLWQEIGAGPWVMGTTAITFSAYVAGSGTSVNYGTANELAYYAADGTTLSGLTTANSGLLVTSVAGAPSIGNDILADITVNSLTVGQGLVSSLGNTALGISALDSVTTANQCTAIGNLALGVATTSINHTAIGSNSMAAVTGGSNSVAVGKNAILTGTAPVQTVAIGVGAGSAASSTNGTYVGHTTGSSITSGTGNTIIGALASASGGAGTALTTGGNNVIIGALSGVDAADAAGCVVLGRSAVGLGSTGATSGDDGPGISIGSGSYKVGFRGDGTIYTGDMWRPVINGTAYMMPLLADGATSVPVTSGGTGVNSATAYALLAGGTTSTAAFQSLATGTAGQLLQSGGAAALPSWTTAAFPSGSGTLNHLLRSDGTDWVETTTVTIDASDAMAGLTSLDVDNINIDGNAITATDTDGNITLIPDGAGGVVVGSGSNTLTLNSSTAIDAVIDDDTMATASATNVPTSESVVAYVASTAGGAGGSTTEIQYNNGGTLDGDQYFTTDALGSVSITRNVSSAIGTVVTNLNTGIAAQARSTLFSDTGNGGLNLYGSGYTGVAGWANVLTLNSSSALDGIRIYTGTKSFRVSTSGTATDEFTLSNTGVATITGQLNVDNLRADGNTISSTDTAGDINLTPDTTGQVLITNDATINGVTVGKGLTSDATNTVVGVEALDAVTTADDSTAMGYRALTSLSSGNNNTAYGSEAVRTNSTGSNNCGFGNNALELTTGSSNVGVGTNAMYMNAGGNNCVGVGQTALGASTSGDYNTAIGYVTGGTITTGGSNTLLGAGTDGSSSSAAGVIAIGRNAVGTTATGATSGDDGAGISIGDATYHVGFRGNGTKYTGDMWRPVINGTAYMMPLLPDGSTAIPVTSGGTGLNSTTANQILYSSATNTIAGLATANNGILVTSAAGVPSIGNTVLADLTINTLTVGLGNSSVINNTAVGVNALNSVTSGRNTAIGYNVMPSLVAASFNSGLGYQALYAVTSGASNTAIGNAALTALSTGSSNVAVGSSALAAATGSTCTAVGAGSGASISSGSTNTLLGYQTGASAASGSAALTTGDHNTFLGSQASGNNLATAGAIAIGANSVADIATGATSGDDGPGIAIGSASYKVGFRGDGTIYSAVGSSAGYLRVKINGTYYKIQLYADS